MPGSDEAPGRTPDDRAPRDVEGEVSDRELMARHVAGDAEAFGVIFARHRDRLWAVALRTLGNREDAADALQDAMVSAFRRAESYRGEAAVTTWLHRIVVNACLDRVRRETVRATDPLPDDDRSTEVASRRDDILDRETSLDVTAALAGVTVEQRAALVLVDMCGYSVEEAARMLDVAPGTIKSRCARGRARLLPLLRGVAGGAGYGPGAASAESPRTEGNRTAAAHVAPTETGEGVRRGAAAAAFDEHDGGGDRRS